MYFHFSKKAEKQYKKLSIHTQETIKEKLLQIRKTWSWDFKVVVNISPATHRLRIGEYRLILQKENNWDFLVLKIWHRKDIYK